MPDLPTSATFTLVRHLDMIDACQWNKLAGHHPLVSHEFLLALDETECAAPQTGWAPHFLLMHRQGVLQGAMPLYLKSHSRGEYVFDGIWAQAFARQGLAYYPKLLGAIPFTPVPGPRLLAQTHADRVSLARQAIEIARDNGISSLHVLFPTNDDRRAFQEAGYLFRENVQFHWFNRGYTSFEDFLSGFNQQKRKKINQDRKKAAQANVKFRWLHGAQISKDDLAFFYRCYHQTYIEHGNAPYLTHAFFTRLMDTMAQSVVLIIAEQNGTPIASALNIKSDTTLYGRYWGSTRFVSGLHFETCYMQAIEFCIKNNLQVFEGGAQGEHKLARGLLPVQTYSAHWIGDQRYAQAITDFLNRETPAVTQYINELQEHSPFKQEG
jgi:predicted N-acyltransferase